MNRIDDMELMDKILRFTRKNRPFPGPRKHCFMPDGMDRGMHEMPRPDEGNFDRPPMPTFHGHHPMGDMPPFGPHGMKRPPLSREHLLVIIKENPDGIRQKFLMEKVGIGQSSVSELVNKLEDDGYIERKVDPSDKRATLLFLTEKGMARAVEVEDERAEFFCSVFSKLNDEEKQALSDIMDKLLAD